MSSQKPTSMLSTEMVDVSDGPNAPTPIGGSTVAHTAVSLRDTRFETVDLNKRLRKAGLRPTRQRLSLAQLLFTKGDRHISAEGLHEEAVAANVPVSLATVYNTLHQFTDAGLLRAVAVESSKTYFDTNTSDHHHFYNETQNTVEDVPASQITVTDLPEPPEGMEIARVDVIVRLREKN